MARSLRSLAGLSVTVLDGVGPERARALEHFGIRTILDLLTHYPRRWIDRTRQARIDELRVGDEAMVLATVRRAHARRTRSRRTLVTVDVTDGSGHLRVTFFNQPWRERQLAPGTDCILFGKVEAFQGRRQMTNPVVDLVGDRTGRIVPVYPQSEKVRLTSWDIARWMEEALRRARELDDPVPSWVLDEHDLVDRTAAVQGIHFPDSLAERDAARRRLVMDELLRIQLSLVSRKRWIERTSRGIAHARPGRLVERFWADLPFELTDDQRRVVDEIVDDLVRPVPMHRLLQGDVGSGKTVVGATALLVAVEGEHQGAFMAPTEVLAEQHHAGLVRWLGGLTVGDGGETLFGERPLRVELLTNRITGKERDRVLGALAAGEVDIVVGTHALIQEQVAFHRLGVVVIDEQHRFGVEQRAALRAKGSDGAVPDVLVMTATPIPRTAAMTVYGDLDRSVLRQKPAHRKPIITTCARTDADVAEVWRSVREQVAAGRQAYVVCPLIEESDKLEASSAESTYVELREGALSGLRLALLHGRVRAADKEATMAAFRDGAVDVLVATTVIEVGVDVPNATVMVILSADRFGIAQLHQLRGRVGRGADQSWCHLVAPAADVDDGDDGDETRSARLDALVRTEDGFELAEVDLELRGEGTIFGEHQKGRTDLKLASLRRDRDVVEAARRAAERIVGDDPTIEGHAGLRDELSLLLADEDLDYLFKG